MTRLLLLLLALAVPVVLAQRAPGGPSVSATERYHAGAQAFIDGDMARASAAVEAGLQVAPNNARLQALRDLIEQNQDQQDQQQGGQNSDDAQNESGGENEQEGDEGQNGDSQNQPPPPEEPGAEQDQTRTQPQNPGQQQDGQGGRDDAPSTAGQASQADATPGEMSRAQAERILDAVGGQEQLLLRELRRAPTRGRRTDKDW